MHYVDSEDVAPSGSFPFPFSSGGVDGAGEDDAAGPSCQAGKDGRPSAGRGDGVALGIVGPRLMSKALRDFNSCCNSASEAFWLSLFFSII